MFQDKVAVVTGGAQGIGRCICEEFAKQGAKVCTIDLLENDFFQGDVGEKEDLERFAQKVIQTYGRVDFLVNNAKPCFWGSIPALGSNSTRLFRWEWRRLFI